MKFIDFFAGIGGIRLGLERAGHKCVGFCEFDKFARRSYTAMYDTEGEWTSSDVRTVKPYDLPAADLWCFGFPCQDISVAGKQKGLQNGERSGLFYEIMRLLAGRRQEDKPRWLLVENVKNLLSIGNGFDFARMLIELGGLGFSCQWQVCNSKDFGVPQNRERVFIVASFGAECRGKIFPLAAADGENPCELQEITQGVADAERVYNGGGISRAIKSTDGGDGAATGLYLLPRKINKPMGEGSSGRLSIKEINNETAACLSSRYYKGVSENGCNAVIAIQKTHGKNITVRANETGTLQAARLDKVPNVLVAPVLMPEREEKRQNGRRMKEQGEPMFTLTAQDRRGVAIVQRGHGFNAGGEHDIAPALTCASYHENNMVKVSGLYTNCRDDFYRGPLEGLSRTLKGCKHDAAVTDGVRIRKLTPRECWRLQGFPDEYFDKAKAAGVSDSQLYKQAGNAVTVNVAEAIGRRLKEIEDDN